MCNMLLKVRCVFSQAAPPLAGEPAAPWTINGALGLLPAVAVAGSGD